MARTDDKDVISLLRSIADSMETMKNDFADSMETMKNDLKDVKARVSKIEWKSNFKDINPWLEMSRSARSAKSNGLRDRVFKVLKVRDRTEREITVY
jgi:hypothetical protein